MKYGWIVNFGFLPGSRFIASVYHSCASCSVIVFLGSSCPHGLEFWAGQLKGSKAIRGGSMDRLCVLVCVLALGSLQVHMILVLPA